MRKRTATEQIAKILREFRADLAVERGEPLQGRRFRRLLKALAEDHLAGEIAVDLVVHVLNASPMKQRRNSMQDPARVDPQRRLARPLSTEDGQRRAEKDYLRRHDPIPWVERLRRAARFDGFPRLFLGWQGVRVGSRREKVDPGRGPSGVRKQAPVLQ